MAVICSHFFNSNFLLCNSSSSSSLNSFKLHSNGDFLERSIGKGRTGKRSSTKSFVVLSTHSNPRILKSNRKSRHGQRLSPYDSDEDGEDEDLDDDDMLSEDEVSEMEDFDADLQNFNSGKATNAKRGYRLPKNQYSESLSRNGRLMGSLDGRLDVKHGKTTLEKRKFEDARRASDKVQENGFKATDSRRKLMQQTRDSKQSRFHQPSEELDLDEKWFPLLDYLSTFGLGESHFTQMFERHMPSLQINVTSAQERLEFLLSVGVKHRDIKKILLRQPQILEYTVENNMKSHVAFLANLGIADSRIGQIISAAPSLFSYSVEHSLKPTVRYLVEEVGIKNTDLSKVVQLSPQILVQRINVSWKSRYVFLSKELGAPRDKIVKMVTKHPQLLHYSIEDGILPKINFLRSIGMQNSDILKVLTSLTQVLSLSLEDNLKPKYSYLVNELRNEVQSLTKYPMYLSLSLDQRIRPRHRFLVSLKKAPKGPFPLSSLVPTNESFCHSWAGTSLEKYLAFKQTLLLKEFAKKYERKW